MTVTNPDTGEVAQAKLSQSQREDPNLRCSEEGRALGPDVFFEEPH